jgi:ATP-binding cassette, subfamily B, multidrug efflux pump
VSTLHDEDVLGKAYDAVLMRRLLIYLRPYWQQVAIAFAAIVVGAGASLAQPYLIKVAIDEHIASRHLQGLSGLAALYAAILVAAFAADYIRPGRCSSPVNGSCSICGWRFTGTSSAWI